MTSTEFVERSRSLHLDFKSFLAWKQEAMTLFPEARDFSETRIARTFANLAPKPSTESRAIHRCDLSRLWLEVRQLPAEIGVRARVCAGVRAALHGLFAGFSQQRSRIAIPSDVYPVYEEIAQRMGLGRFHFPTFPELELPRLLATCSGSHITHVLLPYPLKLHGRAWTDEEVDTAISWLRENSMRRLLLDGVYSFGTTLADHRLLALLDTDQVIYLDSLSKGWLHEWVMGVTILPEQDLYALAPCLMPPVEVGQPSVAHSLLTEFANFPQKLRVHLEAHRHATEMNFSDWGVQSTAERGYLLPVQRNHLDLLVDKNVVALPASVFGSNRAGWSIVSAL